MSLRGFEAIDQGDWEEAESLFRSAIEKDPSDEHAHCHYAELLWRRGVRGEAIQNMERAVSLSGGKAELHVKLGEMYVAYGQLERAWLQAESAIGAQPKLGSAWALRGDVLDRQGRREEALVSYHRALSYQPRYPRVQLAAAEIYRQQNRPRRALATLEAVIDQAGPDGVPSQVMLLQGIALKALGRHDQAIEVLTAASTRGEPDAELLHHLGEAHYLAGDVASAGLTVQAALARDPGHEPSRRLGADIEASQRNLTAGLRPQAAGS
jgi:tetratricopeptide (TPR) repeat protein